MSETSGRPLSIFQTPQASAPPPLTARRAIQTKGRRCNGLRSRDRFTLGRAPFGGDSVRSSPGVVCAGDSFTRGKKDFIGRRGGRGLLEAARLEALSGVKSERNASELVDRIDKFLSFERKFSTL